jgi:hypothetical protein
MERREWVRFLASAAGAGFLQGLAPGDLMAFGRRVHADAGAVQDLKALDAHAAQTVIAAGERIIPVSDTPGAANAQVHRFIDRMLADWHTPAERDRVLGGLGALDQRSRTAHGRAFIACAEAEQTALLTALDDEVTRLRSPAAAETRRGLGIANANEHWFAMLKYLTVLGWLTSEPAMRALGRYPLPGRWDGCASYQPRPRAARPS